MGLCERKIPDICVTVQKKNNNKLHGSPPQRGLFIREADIANTGENPISRIYSVFRRDIFTFGLFPHKGTVQPIVFMEIFIIAVV